MKIVKKIYKMVDFFFKLLNYRNFWPQKILPAKFTSKVAIFFIKIQLLGLKAKNSHFLEFWRVPAKEFIARQDGVESSHIGGK